MKNKDIKIASFLVYFLSLFLMLMAFEHGHLYFISGVGILILLFSFRAALSGPNE